MQNNIKQIKNNLIYDLREFVHGAGFTDVTFGLSGGMDSALVLALAADAFGPSHVHTMMMRTKNTTQLSIDLAAEIAKNIGNPHEIIDIQPMVDQTVKTLSFVPKNKITVENIQARVRGMLCMAYSNEFHRLVLGCGNKSEAFMGYCTLYGDTCGAVMPIGDLYKTTVYKMAELYPKIPRGIIDRAPSAELSPGQKDTDSIPGYDILDPILGVIERGTESDIHDRELLEFAKKRYAAAAFKRIQLPPILKIRA
ncbi:MAG: NAD(+) synthase [Proteobacteria bacterium]|nr:NAD(+) synthase [Pseudomonadota bacterium]